MPPGLWRCRRPRVVRRVGGGRGRRSSRFRQDRVSFCALAHGISGLFPCRSMAWLSSRRSSKPSTRWWRAFSSSCRARSVSLGWAARRAGFSMTLLIGFFSIFHCIHLNLAPGEPEKHPVVPDAEAVFVLRPDQLLEVTLESSLKVVQPRPNALAQFLGQRAKLREGFSSERNSSKLAPAIAYPFFAVSESVPVNAARTLAVSPAKSGATGRRRPGKTRLCSTPCASGSWGR